MVKHSVFNSYNLLNKAISQLTGEEPLEGLDLSELIDTGVSKIEEMGFKTSHLSEALVSVISEQVITAKKYSGVAPNVTKASQEWEGIIQSTRIDGFEFSEDPTYELKAGQHFPLPVYSPAKASSLFFYNKDTSLLEATLPAENLEVYFKGPKELNEFIAAVYTSLNNALVARTDAWSFAAINNMIYATMSEAFPDGDFTKKGNTRAVNLLALYNEQFIKDGQDPLTPERAFTNPEFLRFANFTILNHTDNMKTYSSLFNLEGAKSPTTQENLRCVLFSEFIRGSQFYLQADTFHKELVSLPQMESVVFWQGQGESMDTKEKMTIKIKDKEEEIEIAGILGIAFDDNAIGVYNNSTKSSSEPILKARKTQLYTHVESSVYNDTRENFVVFFMA